MLKVRLGTLFLLSTSMFYQQKKQITCIYLYKTIDYVKGPVLSLYWGINLLHIMVALYLKHYISERCVEDNITCLPCIFLEMYFEIYTMYIKIYIYIYTSRFENDYIHLLNLGKNN